jgi:hypothetical protein
MVTSMPNIEWRNSAAKLIIFMDLEEGLLPVDENKLSAQDAWDLVYKHIREFQNVPFAQFKARLKDHRAKVQTELNRACDDELAFAHDRRLHPRQTHNRRGELVFDMTPAKELLREDIKNKKHEGMTPLSFQASRQEYYQFKPRQFKERIYQEVRYQKFLNYLQMKRDKEKEEAGKHFAV